MHHHCQLLIDLSARLSLLVTHLDQPSKNPLVNPAKQGGQDKAPVKGKSVIKQHANYLKIRKLRKIVNKLIKDAKSRLRDSLVNIATSNLLVLSIYLVLSA